jgi:hypothetical protein
MAHQRSGVLVAELALGRVPPAPGQERAPEPPQGPEQGQAPEQPPEREGREQGLAPELLPEPEPEPLAPARELPVRAE